MTQQPKEFDRDTVLQIRQEMQDALEDIGEKYGLHLDLGNVSFTKKDFRIKMVATIVNAGEGGVNLNSIEAQNFTFYAPRHGIDPNALGKTVKGQHGDITITGWQPRNRRFPVIGLSATGTGVKMPITPIAQQHPDPNANNKTSRGLPLTSFADAMQP